MESSELSLDQSCDFVLLPAYELELEYTEAQRRRALYSCIHRNGACLRPSVHRAPRPRPRRPNLAELAFRVKAEPLLRCATYCSTPYFRHCSSHDHNARNLGAAQ